MKIKTKVYSDTWDKVSADILDSEMYLMNIIECQPEHVRDIELTIDRPIVIDIPDTVVSSDGLSVSWTETTTTYRAPWSD